MKMLHAGDYALAIIVVVFSAVGNVLQAQVSSKLSLGAHIAIRGGWNASITALSRGTFAVSRLPDAGIEVAYALNHPGDAFAVLNLGVTNPVVQSMSIDPFTQRTTNEFIMTAYAVCASATAAIRFLQFLNILPELTILFRGNLPIRLQYDANIDVFETQGAAQPLRGTAVSTYTVPEERLLSFFELGAEIGILTFTVGNGTCSFHMQGAMALSQLVRPIPLLQIPNYYNIIGRDPLAGYRTLNVQPISVSLGLRYMLHDIGW